MHGIVRCRSGLERAMRWPLVRLAHNFQREGFPTLRAMKTVSI
jgi:hypothetical protein